MTLTDTGPLVALCDPGDAQHTVALAHLTRLGRTGLRVCDAVLTEACFHLPRRVQRQRLQALLDALNIESLSTDDAEVRSDVFRWLTKYADHEPDWADGCLAVLCGRDAQLKIWTYDREFRTTWRLPDGRPIPMAVR